MRNKLTIGDVADALGVSKTTVSRAISGKGRISEETTRRVIDYIERHNYRPNVMARGLAQSRTFNIGVICPTGYDILNLPFFHKCLRGIGDVAVAAGYDILLSLMEENDARDLKRLVEHRKVDGVILTRTLVNDPLADYLKGAEVPFVAIGTSLDPAVAHVDNDHMTACARLTETLLKKGCRRLALLGNNEGQIITCIRARGFAQGYVWAGLKEEDALTYLDAADESRLDGIVTDALSRGADGFVCMDEKVTEQLLTVLRRRRIHVPEQVKVASFYDITALANGVPAITAIEFDDRKLGAAATELLLQMLDGKTPESRLLTDYTIHMRESTN